MKLESSCYAQSMSNTLFGQVSRISQQPAPHYAKLLNAPVHTKMKVRMDTSDANALGEWNKGVMDLDKVVMKQNDIIDTIA